MENYIPLGDIQPGQELDPYTVLRLRQAALRGEITDEGKQGDGDPAESGKAAVRKGRKQ